jgi:GT2 family glycosyltransferase
MLPLVIRGSRVPAKPDVSIVILVLDRVELLIRCLESLAAVGGPSHEIVVVGNGTPEDVLAPLSARSDLVVVPVPVNLGFAAGCNWGARFARGRSIVLLNDDTEVEPGWLSALAGAAAQDARIGAVGSRILDFDGGTLEAGGVVWSDGATLRAGRGLPAGAHAHDEVRDVDYCSACGVLVTRTAWDAVGGFDEAYYPAYHEDVDLFLSLRSCGYRTVYCPTARVRHHEGASSRVLYREFAARRNRRHFSEKWAAELAGYEPPPVGRLERAVARATELSRRRPLPPVRPGVVAARTDPTELEALQAQNRALLAAVRLKDAYVEELGAGLPEVESEMAYLRREHEKLESLRSVVRRLPLGRRLARWLSHRLRGRGLG